MKYFSSPSFYVRTYTALTRAWRAQPGDCFGIFALKDQRKLANFSPDSLGNSFVCPADTPTTCPHLWYFVHYSIQNALSLSFLRTTNNKIHFIGLDFHFYSCDFVIVFCKAWTSLRDRRLAWSDNLTKVCAVIAQYQEMYKWGWLRSINIHCNLRGFKSFLMQVTTSCKQKSRAKISPQNGIIAPLHILYEQCKKSRQKQLGKVQWRRRVFAN